MTDPNTPAAPAPDTFPGKGLGIAGLILAIFIPLVGLILSIIANNQSKQAGFKNTPAKVGIIIAIILMILGVILSVVMYFSSMALLSSYGM